jgi:hypothetical protein
MNIIISRSLLALSCMMLYSTTSFAQGVDSSASVASNTFFLNQNSENGGQVDPETGFVYEAPTDPRIPKVKFLKLTPPTTTQERVDRLIQGIKIDIPPEYDHYGYEIRRYMASAGNDEIYKDRRRLEVELANVKNARVVFSYWMVELRREIQAVEADLEAKKDYSATRSTLSYNRGIVDAFQIEAQSWLSNNEELLKFLVENPGAYKLDKTRLIFQESEAMQAFAALFKSREESRARVNEYQPFSMMIY